MDCVPSSKILILLRQAIWSPKRAAIIVGCTRHPFHYDASSISSSAAAYAVSPIFSFSALVRSHRFIGSPGTVKANAPD